jgi:hypothetical protein
LARKGLLGTSRKTLEVAFEFRGWRMPEVPQKLGEVTWCWGPGERRAKGMLLRAILAAILAAIQPKV